MERWITDPGSLFVPTDQEFDTFDEYVAFFAEKKAKPKATEQEATKPDVTKPVVEEEVGATFVEPVTPQLTGWAAMAKNPKAKKPKAKKPKAKKQKQKAKATEAEAEGKGNGAEAEGNWASSICDEVAYVES